MQLELNRRSFFLGTLLLVAVLVAITPTSTATGNPECQEGCACDEFQGVWNTWLWICEPYFPTDCTGITITCPGDGNGREPFSQL